jgi:BirA family transcriptional regulator, biotin operon repressor / biotin---[acetyl-CoA-carboxylase] ligase
VLGPVEVLPETDSTNTRLLARAREGAAEGLVLVADHQTAGRGRLDRTWEAPPGASLLVSVLLRPRLPLERAHLVTIAAALAAAEACEEVAGVTPSLKWPNDLVVEGAGGTRKLAGLLAESLVEGGRLQALVVGMGLNVDWPEERLPAGAVALSGVTDRPVDRDAVLGAWLPRFDDRYRGLPERDGLDDYRRRCATLGRAVRVETSGEVVEGEAVDVTPEGHLAVDTGGGRRTFAVGDVVHLRPAGSP